MRPTLAGCLGCALVVAAADAREPKEFDANVIYDESRIPHYDLPPLLVNSAGEQVTTAAAWQQTRRPEIMALLSNLIYGSVPLPPSPIQREFTVTATDPEFMDGKATRKDIDIRLSNDNGQLTMHLLLFVPNGAGQPVPTFMMHSFDDTRGDKFRASSLRKGRLRNGWPLGDFFARGYAFCAVHHESLVRHNEVEFLQSIHKLFYSPGQSFPKSHEWGVIAACAYGASQGMHYLETDDDVDHRRVAIMGHSKMGKTALWTAARDERFALAISAQSGCAGAALWRRKSGETMDKMVTRFPYWLCRNARKFCEREDDLPVDQHMLLAAIAPRPIYIHSATEDTWADPRGEYLSAYHAGPAYELFGKRGLVSEASPEVGKAIIESDIGYHIRSGGHSITPYDWEQFLRFADYHFQR